MITTTLVLSIVTAVASAVAAYFLGRMDGAASARARYSSMVSNLNSDLQNLVDSVKAASLVEKETEKTEELVNPAADEPVVAGKGTEITELPASAVLPSPEKKKTTKQTPKRKKGKK